MTAGAATITVLELSADVRALLAGADPRQPFDAPWRYKYYTIVDFEFDPHKSAINAEKHGIDFDAAQLLWVDPNRVEFTARFKNEERHGLVASHSRRLWCAIFTLRGEKVRIISVRRARTYEEELYNDS